MNITSAGIGSGLDLEGIITAYIDAEAIPQEIRLQNKEERLTTELSGVGQFKSALSNFESVLKKLNSPEDFNKQISESSSEDVAVTTNGYASNGSFSIEVEQLAQGSRRQSTAFAASTDTVGTGTLTFTAGADSFDVDIDGADDLSAIRDKINEQSSNFGVTANIINVQSGSYLVFNSSATGDANNLTISSSDVSLDAISTNTTQSANDVAKSARAYVDGNLVEQDTNEFKNIIEDVTFTAQAVNMGNPAVISISQDEENGSTLINEFVDAYNALRGTLDALGNAENGALAFDANVRQVKSQLNTIVTDTVSGLTGGNKSLSDIGITIDKTGLLEINPIGIGTMKSGTEKLEDALKFNLQEVGEIFASSNGVTSKLTTLIDSYNGSDGTLTIRNTALSKQVSGIADEYTALETKLRDYEDRLRSQFSYLDSTVASYNATGTWLASTLASMQPKNS
ncbi:flagellar filament capping protein FliD [Thalassotalea profundi]|uniref:Flagellar hook-associated protein 2 n=1 Tax=Thalassotalea profundi TaxID=2036687 RepID=A0ABQ3IFB5_9GAMM|nr:flagellar filament capping protein FliD [Thalassotalea profundi]GHE80999.1 flagellar hook-associated protein 2 [Thalassotalea profundi]